MDGLPARFVQWPGAVGPSAGIASTAWVTQFAYYVGLPVGMACVAFIVTSAVMIVMRRQAVALGMAWLTYAPVLYRGTLLFTAVAGTIWWIGWNTLQYILVLQAGGIMQSGPKLDGDGDWKLVIDSGQLPWGYGDFALLPLVLAILTAIGAVIVVVLARRDTSHGV